MIEIYKDIQGYEGYQISNHGNVKSNSTGKVLKCYKNDNGYLRVTLSKQGKRKFYLIHRLVAEAFIENPNNLPEVNHKDEDKTNNHVTNLEWCTPKYNINYGTCIQRMAESNTNNPKISKQVMCIETGVVYPSTMEVERELGYDHRGISKCCKGKYNTCGGYHWEYVS